MELGGAQTLMADAKPGVCDVRGVEVIPHGTLTFRIDGATHFRSECEYTIAVDNSAE